MIGPNRDNPVDIGVMHGDAFFPWRENVFAGVEVIRGKEQMSPSGQRLPQSVWRLTFDFFDVAGIDEGWTVKFEGNILDITLVMPKFRKRDLTMVEAVAHTFIRTGGGSDGTVDPGSPDAPPATPPTSGDYD